jgi:hypothetical protein
LQVASLIFLSEFLTETQQVLQDLTVNSPSAGVTDQYSSSNSIVL